MRERSARFDRRPRRSMADITLTSHFVRQQLKLGPYSCGMVIKICDGCGAVVKIAPHTRVRISRELWTSPNPGRVRIMDGNFIVHECTPSAVSSLLDRGLLSVSNETEVRYATCANGHGDSEPTSGRPRLG